MNTPKYLQDLEYRNFFGNNFQKISTLDVKPNADIFGFLILDVNNNFRNFRRFSRVINRTENYNRLDFKIPFQFIETVPVFSKSANYEELSDIIGRFESIVVYRNSNASEFNLQLIYAAAGSERLGHKTFWTIERINQIENKLLSLVYPMYDGSYSPPFKVILSIGKIYYIPVKIKNIQIEYNSPFDVETGESYFRKISLDLVSSYPLWQSIGARDIFLMDDEKTALAYMDLSRTRITEYVNRFSS